MTRLRKMMLEELQRRNYSAITTRNYLQVVTDFATPFRQVTRSSSDRMSFEAIKPICCESAS